jgi:hypothetical protein
MSAADLESHGSPGGAADLGDRGTLAALLAGMTVWSGWFIFRSSFVFAGRRVFCLFEDAMISMAYARNLVEGFGLNWARAGAPVEGFTHPLWLALMIPVNLLPVDLRLRSLAVQLVSLAILLADVVLVRRLTLRHFTTPRARHWLPAALLTAAYFPLDCWALIGMESGLQALLTTAAALLALDVVSRGEDRHRALWAVGAAAYLLRMDMLLVVAVVQVYVVAQGGVRREQRAHWWQGLAGFAAAAGAYSAFRWFYFHDLLPNTYYLKLGQIPIAVRLMRGVKLLGAACADHMLLLVVVAAGVAALSRQPLRRELSRRAGLLGSLLMAACAYSVYVGGDAWDMDVNVRANRFVVFVMPLLFVLFNALVNQLSDRMARTAEAGVAAAGDDLARRYVVALATALALVVADGLWLAADTSKNWMALTVASPPFLAPVQAEVYGKLRRLQGELGASGVLATSAAGLPAYFSNYQMVDVLGFNERHIARLPPALPLELDEFMDYVPGHVKWDYAYVLARYHPDAFLHPWGLDNPAALLNAAGYRYDKKDTYWLRGHPPPAPHPAGPAPAAGPALPAAGGAGNPAGPAPAAAGAANPAKRPAAGGR